VTTSLESQELSGDEEIVLLDHVEDMRGERPVGVVLTWDRESYEMLRQLHRMLKHREGTQRRFGRVFVPHKTLRTQCEYHVRTSGRVQLRSIDMVAPPLMANSYVVASLQAPIVSNAWTSTHIKGALSYVCRPGEGLLLITDDEQAEVVSSEVALDLGPESQPPESP
jgi:hypothetical protein